MTKKQIKKTAKAVIKLAKATETSLSAVVAALVAHGIITEDYSARVIDMALQIRDQKRPSSKQL